jgi:hypothetical protein
MQEFDMVDPFLASIVAPEANEQVIHDLGSFAHQQRQEYVSRSLRTKVCQETEKRLMQPEPPTTYSM